MLRLLAEAEAEIESARSYLNSQSPDLGDRLLAEIATTCDAIRIRPLSFAKLETLPPEQPYRRALLPTFHYAIIFEVLDEEIVVVAVAHTSRNANYWLDRP